jgi:hypothetical protein
VYVDPNLPWCHRLYLNAYIYVLLMIMFVGSLFMTKVYEPIERLAYKWKYRKEHREMRRKYLK